MKASKTGCATSEYGSRDTRGWPWPSFRSSWLGRGVWPHSSDETRQHFACYVQLLGDTTVFSRSIDEVAITEYEMRTASEWLDLPLGGRPVICAADCEARFD